jgi:hypothetical protein
MWLNGFNDNVPGFPKVECEMVKCPEPYMGSEQPGEKYIDRLMCLCMCLSFTCSSLRFDSNNQCFV